MISRTFAHFWAVQEVYHKAILVEVLREALKGKGAKTLRGLDGISEGRGEGTHWNTRVDVGGGGSKATGKERGQDLKCLSMTSSLIGSTYKGLHSDSLGCCTRCGRDRMVLPFIPAAPNRSPARGNRRKPACHIARNSLYITNYAAEHFGK